MEITASLNAASNKVLDILREYNVGLTLTDTMNVAFKDRDEGVILPLNEVRRTSAYRKDTPPIDWAAFLAQTTDTFVEKDTDYRHKYTRGLIEHGKIIWVWEVDKKLDRIRTWIDRGELKVKGEGLNNAVSDLFNYTVLYDLFIQADSQDVDPLKYLTERYFYKTAASQEPEVWVGIIEDEGLIEPGEEKVKGTVFKYMGVA